MKKIVQKFSEEYFEQTRNITPTQACQFAEDYRKLVESQLLGQDESQLISIKIPKKMLLAFRNKCEFENVRYQTQIKNLMLAWLGLNPKN